MYRNLKFLHMTDFFSTDTVRVSVTNIRYGWSFFPETKLTHFLYENGPQMVIPIWHLVQAQKIIGPCVRGVRSMGPGLSTLCNWRMLLKLNCVTLADEDTNSMPADYANSSRYCRYICAIHSKTVLIFRPYMDRNRNREHCEVCDLSLNSIKHNNWFSGSSQSMSNVIVTLLSFINVTTYMFICILQTMSLL